MNNAEDVTVVKRKDSFVFYKSFFDAMERIEDKALAYECLRAMCNYAFYGEIPEDPPLAVGIVFDMMKPQLDANHERYVNGCKGGRPKKNTDMEEPSDSDGDSTTSYLDSDKPEAEQKRLAKERDKFIHKKH